MAAKKPAKRKEVLYYSGDEGGFYENLPCEKCKSMGEETDVLEALDYPYGTMFKVTFEEL